jgi:hypothetical protein
MIYGRLGAPEQQEKEDDCVKTRAQRRPTRECLESRRVTGCDFRLSGGTRDHRGVTGAHRSR